jgi:DNA-binding HxlR family transcriptional regulator
MVCNSSDLADSQNLDAAPADVELLAVLGHPVRLRVIELLSEGDARQRDLLPHLEVTSGSLSRMLGELRDARLIDRLGAGTHAPYRLVLPERTNELIDLAVLLGSELSDVFVERATDRARADRQRLEDRTHGGAD